MAADAAENPLKHDGADMVAELWAAVEAVAKRPPEARDAVRSVLRSLLAEEGEDGAFAPTLHAALAAVGPGLEVVPDAPQDEERASSARTAGFRRIAAFGWTSGS